MDCVIDHVIDRGRADVDVPMTYDAPQVLLVCREEDRRQAVVREDVGSVVGLSEHRAIHEKAHDLTWGGGSANDDPREGKLCIRTQTALVRANPFRNLRQRKLLIPKDIGDPEFRCDLDSVRFMEASNESHANI